MVTELGIGVRVYVGWCPADQVTNTTVDARMMTGTITDGPFEPGFYEVRGGGRARFIGERSWNVALDGGDETGAVESILFPMDDGDEHVTEGVEETACGQ